MHIHTIHLNVPADGVPKPPTTVIRVVPWITFGFNIFFCISGVAFAAVCIVLMLVLWNRRYPMEIIH